MILLNGNHVPRIELPRQHIAVAFETVLFWHGEPVLWEWHLHRLCHSSRALGIPEPPLPEFAGLRVGSDNGRGRLTWTGEDWILELTPLPAPPRSLTLTTTPWSVPMQPTHTAKTSSYGINALAWQYAQDQGADDCVLVNSEGRVMEACFANICAVIDDVVVTPPIADGGLGGATREFLLRTEDVEVRSLSLGDLAGAQEIFLASSIRMVIPVTRLLWGPRTFTFESARATAMADRLWAAMPVNLPAGPELFQV